MSSLSFVRLSLLRHLVSNFLARACMRLPSVKTRRVSRVDVNLKTSCQNRFSTNFPSNLFVTLNPIFNCQHNVSLYPPVFRAHLWKLKMPWKSHGKKKNTKGGLMFVLSLSFPIPILRVSQTQQRYSVQTFSLMARNLPLPLFFLFDQPDIPK